MRVVSAIQFGEPNYIGSCDDVGDKMMFSVEIPEGSAIKPNVPESPGKVWFSSMTLNRRGVTERVVMADESIAVLLPGWMPNPQ